MNFMKYTGECPEVYREGGEGLLDSVLDIGTLGLTRALGITGIEAPTMPTAPKGPDSISTGQTVKSAAGKTLGDEDENRILKARKTARKGATAYRIPLESKVSGIGGTSDNSTGLGI